VRSTLTMSELALEDSIRERMDLEERVAHFLAQGGGGGGGGDEMLRKIKMVKREMEDLQTAHERELKRAAEGAEVRLQAVEGRAAVAENALVQEQEVREGLRRRVDALSYVCLMCS
jgi:hypothetical protein